MSFSSVDQEPVLIQPTLGALLGTQMFSKLTSDVFTSGNIQNPIPAQYQEGCRSQFRLATLMYDDVGNHPFCATITSTLTMHAHLKTLLTKSAWYRRTRQIRWASSKKSPLLFR